MMKDLQFQLKMALEKFKNLFNLDKALENVTSTIESCEQKLM